MAINYHPKPGTIVLCDFSKGFKEPEMVKLRPAVVLSPYIRSRGKLCTVVALSTTRPNKVQDFHCELELKSPPPPPWNARKVWVKGDIVNTVGFHRLNLIRNGRDKNGARKYYMDRLNDCDINTIRQCVLFGLGMHLLTISS